MGHAARYLECNKATRALVSAVGCALALACTSESTKPTADSASHVDAVATPAPTCAPGRTLATGVCCPTGTSATAGGCAAVGPPECQGAPSLETCVPRWCWQWRDATGAACEPHSGLACQLAGRACSDAELIAGKGCPAGTQPTASGGCTAVGLFAAATVDALAAAPPLGEPPMPRACGTASDWPRACQSGEKGCPAGEEPTADGSCTPIVGTALLCPAGFVPVAAPTPDDLPLCAPDPAECGSDPYGGVAEGANTVFVAAGAAAGGAGSRSAPFATLSEGLAALPQGGTLAVAEGTYTETLSIGQRIDLRGRCAAKVVLTSKLKGAPVLGISGAAATGTAIRGVALTKSDVALRVTATLNVEVRKVWCNANPTRAVAVVQGASVQVADSYIADTGKDSPTPLLGSCLTVSGPKSDLRLDRVRISGCSGPAVQAEGPAHVLARDVVIDRGNPQHAEGASGRGVNAFAGASVELDGVRLHHTEFIAISLTSGGSKLTARRLAVEHTALSAAGKANGAALRMDKGAVAHIAGARIVDSGDVGLYAEDPGTKLSLQAALVDGTRPTQPQKDKFYGGLVCIADAQAVVQDSVLAHHGHAAAHAWHGGKVALQRVVLDCRGTPAQPQAGGGMYVNNAGLVELSDVHMIGHRGAAFEVVNESLLVGKGVTTQSGTAGALDHGPAFYIDTGSTLRVEGCRLSLAAMAAVLAFEPTSTVALAACLIDNTAASPLNGLGMGIVAQFGVKVALAGVRATTNTGAGIVVAGSGGGLVAHGVVVDGTRGRSTDSSGGHGIYGAQGATVDLHAVLVAANRSTGVAQDQGALTADRIVVRDTQFSPLVNTDLRAGPQLADGILAVHATSCSVARSVLFGNLRSALLVDAAKQATLTSSYARGGIYGLVTQGGSTLAVTGSAVFGASQQNRAGDTGLAVPPPPLLVSP